MKLQKERIKGKSSERTSNTGKEKKWQERRRASRGEGGNCNTSMGLYIWGLNEVAIQRRVSLSTNKLGIRMHPIATMNDNFLAGVKIYPLPAKS
jgi:hypothetical protein